MLLELGQCWLWWVEQWEDGTVRESQASGSAASQGARHSSVWVGWLVEGVVVSGQRKCEHPLTWPERAQARMLKALRWRFDGALRVTARASQLQRYCKTARRGATLCATWGLRWPWDRHLTTSELLQRLSRYGGGARTDSGDAQTTAMRSVVPCLVGWRW